MKNVRLIVALTLVLAGVAGMAAAEDRPWEFSLGLSYLATSGNSESQTGGLDLSYKRRFAPWRPRGGRRFPQCRGERYRDRESHVFRRAREPNVR